MISKEIFCQAIQAIQSDWEKNRRLDKLLDDCFDGYVSIKESHSFGMLIEVLKEALHDTNSLIDWWLFDDVSKFIYDDDGNVTNDLTNVEALYDYLIENI